MTEPGTAAPVELGDVIDAVAEESGFSGAVRVDRPGAVPVERARGFADRAHLVPMTPDTRIGVASGAKTLTALAVLRLVEDGVLALDTPARSLLGADLPLVDDRVTVEHLLCHRSGIGDYLDESELDDPDAYVMPVPVHTLDTAESYLAVLGGHPQVFAPGTDFAYCNGGFVVLALLAERAAGTPFHTLVREQVLEPAGLDRTAYLRTDELPGDAAVGYLRTGGLHPGGLHPGSLRANVLHLPVIGGGDGGVFTTAGDVARLWAALDAGRVVSAATREDAWRSRSVLPDDQGYGLGFWRQGRAVEMHGADAGASFHAVHVPGRVTWSVLSNTTGGAWPMVRRLCEVLDDDGAGPDDGAGRDGGAG